MDDQPRGLGALLARFRNGEAALGFVRTRLISGAIYALAFVRRRHPYLCFTGIGDVPPQPDGTPTSMEHHYRAVEDVAIDLVDKLEHDTELQLQHVTLQVSKAELRN